MDRPRTEIIDRLSRLEALAAPWTELWECAPGATPFQHPAWILAFYREMGIRMPRVLAAWEGQRLVCLAPFYLWQTDASSTLVLAGNGVSDYLDGLVHPGRESGAEAAFRAFIDGLGPEWDEADCRDLDPEAFVRRVPWPGAGSDVTLPEEGCPRLALPDDFSLVLAQASKALRRDVTRAERKLADAGRLEISLATCASLSVDYEGLVKLHTAKWQAAGQPGIFDAPFRRRFFLAGFEGLAAAGMLRLLLVRLNGEPVAAACGFLHRNRYYHFITGHDPQWSHLSLGSFAVYLALQVAVKERAVCFDFLRGRESYKYRWGARDRQTYRRVVRRDCSTSPQRCGK